MAAVVLPYYWKKHELGQTAERIRFFPPSGLFHPMFINLIRIPEYLFAPRI
jgi:hypothetical protein